MGSLHDDYLVLSVTLPRPKVVGTYKEGSRYQGLPVDLQNSKDVWKFLHTPEQELHWEKIIHCRCVQG